MMEYRSGATGASLIMCRRLLDSKQTVATDPMVRDDLAEPTCDKIQDKNQARIIRSIKSYIAPLVGNPETLLDGRHPKHVTEG